MPVITVKLNRYEVFPIMISLLHALQELNRKNTITFEVSTTQYSSYQTTFSQPPVQQNQLQENYIHAVPNAVPQNIILQPEHHLARRVVSEVPCEPPPPPVPLFPPPTLRSPTESAACIAKKKIERTRRFAMPNNRSITFVILL